MFARIKQYLKTHTAYGKSRYLNYLYRYDMTRYYAHSGMNQQDAHALAARIRLLVHALEKGLSVASDRTDFGKEKTLELLALMEQYRSLSVPADPQVLALGAGILASYKQHRSAHGLDCSFLPDLPDPVCPAGIALHTPADLSDFARIAQLRHSVRQFGSAPVPRDSLIKAVSLAQTAPSACNRQASHVYACTDPEKIQAIMARHGGTRGFRTPGCVLVLTGDLRLYQNEYERNTVFLDGGIFLMNLLYSLACYDLAACPIIWGAEPDNDGFLYNLLQIPRQQELLSLVLVGSQSDSPCWIPVSTRRDTGEVLHFVP